METQLKVKLESFRERIFSIRDFPEHGNMRPSFEFFPPKTQELEDKLWESVHKLAPLNPRFVSVTYGAGGSTRARTHDIVKRIQQETNLRTAAHLTCVGASRNEVDQVITDYWNCGIRHIVALRGDVPDGGKYNPHPQGYSNAAELVAGIKRIGNFEISVAAYPEVHPDSINEAVDLDNLKRKIDAGANRAITQFFFEVEDYLKFLEKVRRAGINAEIVPGILPVTNVGQLLKFSRMCGAKVPNWLHTLFGGLDDDPITRNLVAATVAAEQCRLLQANGVTDFHFYTLNRAELSYAICHILGVGRQENKASQPQAKSA